MDSDLPFGYTHGQKRSHAHMELDRSSSPTWSDLRRLSVSREPSASASRPQHSGLHLPHMNNNMASTLPRHYPGDGLDFRRPVTSSNVIDLTDEDAGPSSSAPSHDQQRSARPPRPPRFGRAIMQDVIDVDAEEARRVPVAPGSPEVEFVSVRPRDPPSRPSSTPFEHITIDDDEVEFVRENPLPESRRRRSLEFVHAFLSNPDLRDQVPHLRAQVERRANDLRANAERDHARRAREATERRITQMFGNMQRRAIRDPRDPIPPRRRGRNHIHGVFVTPNLDFGAVGFDLGLIHEPEVAPAPAPAPPTYDAPEKAPQGFTRSPQEDDILICPNCEEELCAGDSEIKRQVWIVKGCGHVYCGECTTNRFVKKSAKGKERQAAPRTKPFKECVVEGCQKKLSSRSAMIQVFL